MTNCRSVTGRTFDDTRWQRKRFKTLTLGSKPAWSRHPAQSEAARGERQRVRRNMGWGGVLATLWLPWMEKRGGGGGELPKESEVSGRDRGLPLGSGGNTRDRQTRGPAVARHSVGSGSPGRAGVTATEPGPESHHGPG